eukprot:1423651-Rhodomonas_salina.1
MLEWAREIEGDEWGDWATTRSTLQRRTEELDSGVFAIADAICISEGIDPCMQQEGARAMRKWLTFLTWLEGDMTVTIENTTITPRETRSLNGSFPQTITRRSRWPKEGDGPGG